MKHAFALIAMLAMAPVPALAQEENNDLSRGTELLREGMGLMLQGMLDEMRPATEGLAEGWAEGWGKLVELLADFSAYEAPEVLPNGDIIIRRKEPLLPENPLENVPDEAGEVDL